MHYGNRRCRTETDCSDFLDGKIVEDLREEGSLELDAPEQ